MRFPALLYLFARSAGMLFGQTNDGEIRFAIRDDTNRTIAATISVRSASNSVEKATRAGTNGAASFLHLPYGVYQYQISQAGFIPQSGTVEVHSPLPVDLAITLHVGSVETTVNVEEESTLLDESQIASPSNISSRRLAERDRSQPGRSLPDLIAAEPGWLLEANGVIHPRGSEYQVQYVVDGLPLTDNRSPSFAPPFDADSIQSIQILTGSYPAEFGRKLGGVVEVTTTPDSKPGVHATATIGRRSFGSEFASLDTQYAEGANLFGLSGEAETTGRYLDPPVVQNFTNNATTSSFTGHYQRDFDPDDRLSFSYMHSEARFEVPNELVQQTAGQRQDRSSQDNEVRGHFQRILSPDLLFRVDGLFEDIGAALWSNALSTPVAAFQNRGFREGYVSASFAGQHGSNDWKAGGDFLYTAVHENLSYSITDAALFDPGTPPQFVFHDRAPDREGSGYAQDVYHAHNVNLSAGLRWDGYDLLVRQQAWSPRLGASVYWPWAKLLVHGSYDRVFQTPAIENLLLASSPDVGSLSSQVLRLPVQPSRGNFYETGVSRAFGGHIRIDVNWFRRNVTNFADDDVLFNTGVSFPIAFSSARIAGTEVRVSVPRWGRFSGFLSYSNQTGTGFLPVTGGLFLGSDIAGQVGVRTSFPISQDQRNTASAQVRWQATQRIWMAAASSYGSGLPAEINDSLATLQAEYSPAILNRVNFSNDRVRPFYVLNFSGGATLWTHESRTVSLQADLYNATGRLNVIDFAGLFSGTALGAPRSASASLRFGF